MSMNSPVPNQGKQREQNLDNLESTRPAKRARVAVACTRCKSRKQKCDGAQPKCGNCKNLTIQCEYIVPSKTIPHGKYQYIKALEARVAELEGLVATSSPAITGVARWHAGSVQDPVPEVFEQSPSPLKVQVEDPCVTEATQFLKDLSLHAGGGYVGDESSNVTVGQIFGSITRIEYLNEPEDRARAGLQSQTIPNGLEDETSPNPLAEISPALAEVLFKSYLKHISTRWAVLHRPYIIYLHKKNCTITLTDPVEVSTLNLIYAIGGRFLETIGEMGPAQPERHYQAAVAHLSTVLQPHDVASAQTLLLHAIYCVRAPKGLSAWCNVGLAVRICMSLGLHRKPAIPQMSLAYEIKKRVFWSCYCLDRQVSILLGRPFAIADRDIDAELPLDIPDSMNDAAIQALSNPDPNHRPEPSTSLSCFIHIIRLRRIESHIQQSIYRVDKHKPLSRPKIDRFLNILEEWKSNSPPPFPDHDTETYSYDGVHYYEVYYYKCLRLLLYPHLSSPIVDPDIVIRCADACGGVCRAYKALHRDTTVGFSLIAIYSIFLSGLTLLYCLWMSPATIYSTTTTNDLNACSVLLYVIAERWPEAKRYRDAFEVIKQNVLSKLERGPQTTQRIPVPGIRNTGLEGLSSEGFHPGEAQEYSKMMSEMVNPAQYQHYQTMAMPPPPPTIAHRPRAMSDQTNIRPSSQSPHPSMDSRISQSLSHTNFESNPSHFSATPAYNIQTLYASSPTQLASGVGVATLPSMYSFTNARTSSISSQHYAPEQSTLPATGEATEEEDYPSGGYLESRNNYGRD